MLLHLSTTLLPALAAALSIQQIFNPPSLSFNDGYTTLTHEAHPDHKLHIRSHDHAKDSDKQSNSEPIFEYCKGATNGYTGYLNTQNDTKHFYFAYFESRSSPSTDPLVMWINGGPGCSSMMGLLMELGPCSINAHGNGTTANPHSWTEAANVFFLDQPIGVGFSYDSSPDPAHSKGSFAAAEDVYAFMRLWYKQFPESKSQPFNIAGESYGGHYIPIFASHILDENELAVKEGRKQDIIPLSSVMIGNGIFDPLRQDSSAWDVTCTNVTGIGPVLDKTTCAQMETTIDRCEYLWGACYEYPDPLICRAAEQFCAENIQRPFQKTGLNVYDISKPCYGDLCYKEVDAISTYLNRQDVRDAFGVDTAVKSFAACSSRVGEDFHRVGDGSTPTTTYATSLLNRGLRVLSYVGSYDWICNFVGNERFLLALPWIGDYGYRHAATYEQKKWAGGEWWEFGNLRYARIVGAGHMVPFDKPEIALSMAKSWLKGESLE